MSVTEKTLIGTIDCTPSWSAVTPGLLDLYAGGTWQQKSDVRDEMMKMARLADLYVAEHKKT